LPVLPRMRIVLQGSEAGPGRDVPPVRPRLPSDADVPRVQHDGRWHTLH
jgi:hypothetical protein